MAAALAVLKHLKTQGATLQQQLNQRTSQFVAALNAFEEDEVPVRMAHFSLFGPASAENPASRGILLSQKVWTCYAITCSTGEFTSGGGTYPQPIQMKILIT